MVDVAEAFSDKLELVLLVAMATLTLVDGYYSHNAITTMDEKCPELSKVVTEVTGTIGTITIWVSGPGTEKGCLETHCGVKALVKSSLKACAETAALKTLLWKTTDAVKKASHIGKHGDGKAPALITDNVAKTCIGEEGHEVP